MSQVTWDQELESAPPGVSGEVVDRREQRLVRWGGIAGLGGVACLIGSVVVVVSLGLPDADDVETLTDFADIESGRIAEHLLYLAALMLLGLQVVVLQRVLAAAHPVAALFGGAVAGAGFVVLMASSMLHVSTAPLADRYRDPATSDEGRAAVEQAWVAAQSVFDSMLIVGLLLVPIGLALLGLAMSRAPEFGRGLAVTSIVVAAAGFVGALVETVDTSTDFAALSVLAMAVFAVVVGRRMVRLEPEAAANGEASVEEVRA